MLGKGGDMGLVINKVLSVEKGWELVLILNGCIRLMTNWNCRDLNWSFYLRR